MPTGFGLRPGAKAPDEPPTPYRLRASPRLYKSLCGSVIVVLNKNREFSKKESKDEAERRKELWKDGCGARDVDRVIEFDAHWASPRMTRSFLDSIYGLLGPDEQVHFKNGLEKFTNRQRDARDRAIEYALECLVKCRSVDLTSELRSIAGEEDDAYLDRIKQAVSERCKDQIQSFVENSTALYALAAELPDVKIENLGDFDANLAKMSSLQVAGFSAALLSALFGLGGFLASALFASLTAAAGASIGGAIGGGLGVVVGFAGASSEEEKLKAIQAGYVAAMCLGTLWILSCYGWGKGSTIPKHLFQAIDEKSKEVMLGIDPINWHLAPSSEMKEWMTRFLDRVAEL